MNVQLTTLRSLLPIVNHDNIRNVLNVSGTFPGEILNNASSPVAGVAPASISACEYDVPPGYNAEDAAPPFPSCYTWPQIILFAVFMAVVMFVIVFGNLLVIISIMTNASLKNVQNYLLVSLAVADCCVGALIMPLSLANEVMGYWAFGDFLCDSW